MMMMMNIENITSSCIIQNSQWNPMGNILLIIHHNDIYWMNMDHQTDHNQYIVRVTNDGSVIDSIYNGLNDHVYRDLIFEKPTSIWWSPTRNRDNDGHHYYYLCYLQINNSQVPLSAISLYEDDHSILSYRYSTINSSIGNVNLWIIEIDGQTNKFRKRIRVKPPEKLNQRENYVVYVDWIGSNQLIVLWTLRDQKRSILGSCEAVNNWQCEELVTLRNWLQMNHVPHSILPAKRIIPGAANISANGSFLENKELFFCGQIPENSIKTFHQLYSFNVKEKVINSYLNMAERRPDLQHYQIIELLGYNYDSKLIFFVGESLNQSNDDETLISEQDMRTNLFVFSFDFSSVHCLTCQLVRCHQTKQLNTSSICINLMNSASINEKDPDEESCIFKRVHLSPSAEYAIITCLIGIVPKVYLIKFITTTNKFDDSEQSLDLVEDIILFDDNSELETIVESKMVPNVENFIFTRENDNLIKYLRIKLLTPPDFNNEDVAKYSMLFEMYPARYQLHYLSETNGQNGKVFNAEKYPDLEWAIHMVTEHDFVYAWIDGQFFQNNNSIHEISLEELLDDYSTSIDFILTNMTFVNPSQTCLIGHNIGAFFVLNSLSTTSIECGISISPLINWNTINSFIAEQYLDLEKIRSNDLQYLLKMTLNRKMLENKNLLIIHGTSNEMFPVAHTMKLIKILTFDEYNRYINYQSLTIKNEYEINWTNHHFLELYVDHGNSFENIIEHFYRKIEFFLFQWIII